MYKKQNGLWLLKCENILTQTIQMFSMANINGDELLLYHR